MNLFDSVFADITTFNAGYLFLAIGLALVTGLVMAWIVSLRVRSSKGFFITVTLVPGIISLIFVLITLFISDSTTSDIARLVTIAVAFGLIRFRSAQSKAEELVVLFMATAVGLAFGLGYLAYGLIFGIALTFIFFGLTYLPIFTHKSQIEEKLLKITIPETLDYSDVFDATFEHYLKEAELVGVKTVGMGSMFRLSYRIKMKDPKEEKELIDELRIKNGNLEIAVLPYTEEKGKL